MKKLLASFCAIALIIAIGFGFSACKGSKGKNGTYKVISAEAMGMTATQGTFNNYAASRSEDEKKGNSLYYALQVLMNIEITIKNDNRVTLKFAGLKDLLADDPHYSNAYTTAKNAGYITDNGDLVIDDLALNPDNKQADCYYIERADANGNPLVDSDGYIRGFSEIFGVKLTKNEYIHARVKDNQIAFNMSIVLYEREGEAAQSGFSTNVSLYMAK